MTKTTNALVCRACGKREDMDAPIWKCSCGGLLDLDFNPVFDKEAIAARKPDMWRYREALPVGEGHEVSFGEGFTPLLPLGFGGREVLVKQEQLFPSGSFKDRGASVLVSKARELGVAAVVEDSSGNAGASVAAYCARAGIACDIYVPESTAAGKLAQIQWCGARLVKTPGSREDTARAVLRAAETTFYASHCYNPYFFHGTKTWAFEVAEQLGWEAPDTCVLPAGNGTLLLGASIGFRELLAAGVIDRLPKLVAVQSTACAPLAASFAKGTDEMVPFDATETLAEGIAIAEPVRGPQILDAVRETGGAFLTVSEREIVAALRLVCARGHYIEPTSAAAVAGAIRYAGSAPKDERIVSVFTGHGLKTTEKMLALLEK